MEAKFAAAKVGKYATSASGDTLEMVERPGGGLSFVLSDGQRSGKPAKAISNVVTRKAISLLADGVRDGPAARAASDYLYTYRSGKVLATLNILSVDLDTQTMVVVRNNPEPVLVIRSGELLHLDEDSAAIGSRKGIRPAIREFDLSEGLTAIVYSDGLAHAGDRSGNRFDIIGTVRELMQQASPEPESWSDQLLARAIELDQGKPADDITVLIASILPTQGDQVRRLVVQIDL